MQAWNGADKKQAVLDALEEQGLPLEVLQEAHGNAADLDPFDLILHLAYNRPAMTRTERARRLQKDGFLQAYSAECRQVLSALLDKYKNEGISLDDTAILTNAPFKDIGSPKKIIQLFGGMGKYREAVRSLENRMYDVPPELLQQAVQMGNPAARQV